MDSSIYPLVGAVITASVIGVTALINYRNRQSDRVKLTRDLFNQYFANTLLKSRTEAWLWLEQLQKENPRRSFEQLWRVYSDQENFMHLYSVLAFWFLLFHLYGDGQVNKRLAKNLFSYEFYWWFTQVQHLVERTTEVDRAFPDVLKAFKDRSWLLSAEELPRAKEF